MGQRKRTQFSTSAACRAQGEGEQGATSGINELGSLSVTPVQKHQRVQTVSLKIIPRCNYLSKNDTPEFRKGVVVTVVQGWREYPGMDFPFLCWLGKWGGGGRGSDCSLTTSTGNLLPEEMLTSDHPADLLPTKLRAEPSKNPRHPSPRQQPHFTCDLAQPVVRTEPLNTSPERGD